jgi:hypothetical protein
MNRARLHITRIPKGADLILNKVWGAPAFWIGNAIVMAGVPSIIARGAQVGDKPWLFLLEDVCIGTTRPSCRGSDERLRQRREQFDEALSLVRRADRCLARKQTGEQSS